MFKSKHVAAEIAAIKKSLDCIESHMAWLIPADHRFKVGQRVEWSRRGRKLGFPRRKCAQKGTVKKVLTFSIKVKLDGLKKITEFQHSFFNPVGGPKLF